MDNKKLARMIRRNKRTEFLRNFVRSSKIIWILESFPYETHLIFQRSVIENHKRDRLRQKYSWHSILRLKNEKALKAGLMGIITAPILAGLSTIPSLSFLSIKFPIQMGFIFFSGILYVIATALCSKRVPEFVRRFVEPDENRKYKPETIREARSSILLEFLKLGRTITINKSNVHELADHKMAHNVAITLLTRGDSCFKVGFNAEGHALIEKLLYKLAVKHDFKIYEEYTRADGETGLHLRSGPGATFPAGKIYVRHLRIERAKDHFVPTLNPEFVKDEVIIGDHDLVINFYDPYIQTIDQISKRSQLDPYVQGIEHILREEYADTLIEEFAYWQSWQRPFSRVFVLWIYRLSLLSFAIFLIYQGAVVVRALANLGNILSLAQI